VTIEEFLGCAESAVLILNKPMKFGVYKHVINCTTYRQYRPHPLCALLSYMTNVITVDLAQPRNRSIVTEHLLIYADPGFYRQLIYTNEYIPYNNIGHCCGSILLSCCFRCTPHVWLHTLPWFLRPSLCKHHQNFPCLSCQPPRISE